MTATGKINILLVDDLPAKLLSLEAILEDLAENIIKANSADEALHLLLTHDIAVVLIDVCMPGMNGFELAEMIRGHPRYQRTAIIFISAVHLSDEDRLKGYDLGAVDYIPVPIIPAVLRAKVAVFAELYRKTEELQSLNRELEQRVNERTADLRASAERLRESEDRFQQIAHTIDEAFWLARVFPTPQMLYLSPAWEKIWGRPATEESDPLRLWGGTIHPDDQEDVMRCIETAQAPNQNGVWEREYRIVRPRGEIRWVRERGRVLKRDDSAEVRCVGVVEDITQRKAAEWERERLLAVLEATPDFVAIADADQRVRYLNPAARRLNDAGEASEEPGRALSIFRGPLAASAAADAEAGRASAVWEGESVVETVEGARIPVSQVIIAHRGSDGKVEAYSTVARDISERKRAEEVLARDRETLERLIADRTAQLEASNRRLRLADRMATIGTLSAGLGHDMGNLLLPVRMRLDVIESYDLPEEVRESVAGIRKASEYLQRLARSLRLLSLDPNSQGSEDEETGLHEWWEEVEGLVRNALHSGITISSDLPPDLPRVRIGRVGLTQIVFNIVQNAGDALSGRVDGVVQISAAASPDRTSVTLRISDNGPGMSDEIKRRCIEPFFTTKTRGLSTGLGLALVAGIVKHARGAMQIEGEQGKGTTFVITLPATATPEPRDEPRDTRRAVASVVLSDRRLLAHVTAVLSSLEFEVNQGDQRGADILITEVDPTGRISAAEAFIAAKPTSRAVVFGSSSAPATQGRITFLEANTKPSVLRSRFRSLLCAPN